MNFATKRKYFAIAFTCFLSWVFAYLATNVFRNYAFGLFVWLPFFMGMSSSGLLLYKNNTSRSIVRNTAYTTLFIFCLGLLVFAWEGVICLIMAAPLGLFFTWLGYRTAYYCLEKKTIATHSPIVITFLIISVPSFMAFENKIEMDVDLRHVTTTVDINASSNIVWKNVIAFPHLREPKEFIFKSGIAYPINATISGTTVGAIRRCNFSTGSFVEPITVWDEGRLLTFSVIDQPEPMKEISIYNIHPNHLHGYWVSQKGQFKLTALPNGHTILEGTTWYINKIKPTLYWTIWSDYIVHKIHTRVLEHIKIQSEIASSQLKSK